ncbi:hypothetical protein HGA34_00150 [Candidatus Falkowbacteria bacterium]|nr:hypothetical protein [Candidatus Falkowbacteria bacterium]
MGSGCSRDSYEESFSRTKKAFTGDAGTRAKESEARGERIHRAKETVTEEKHEETREEKVDPSKIRLGITKPSTTAKRVHIFLVDNSGSNRAIAEGLRKSSGYLSAVHGVIDPESDFANIFFSDHCDGSRIMQEVDYVPPTPEGDLILLSTISRIYPAGGGDAPEAIECAMKRACELDFGGALYKHLYLVSDEVAHGMGRSGDDGCPLQVNWRDELERVHETYDTFEVIGCGNEAKVAELQKKFLSPERLAYDFIDLSAIKEHEHRLGITANAILFLVARKQGIQMVEVFLAGLYEKWLASPVFGANTEMKAKEAIRRFGKYLEAPESEIEAMMQRVLV